MFLYVNWRSNLLYLLTALFLSAVSTASPLSSSVDLRQLQKQEVSTNSREQIEILNKQMLLTLEAEVPPLALERRQFATLFELENLYTGTLFHKVVSPLNLAYDHSEVRLGFCFGRATYAHLKLLALGLQKESIQKIWAVGVMHASENGIPVTWDFHVATIAYTVEMGWMVVDTYLGTVVTVAEWMSALQKVNPDGVLRFYNTEASKFGLSLGSYSRAQMGLDLSREVDWYKGYFQDMMKALKEETGQDVAPSR